MHSARVRDARVIRACCPFAGRSLLKLGFTGSRKGLSSTQADAIERLLTAMSIDEVHHGDSVGADAEFHELASQLLLDVVVHPPVDARQQAYVKGAARTYPPLDHLDRNKNMVLSTDMLIAAVQGQERQRSGTWATVRYARKLKRPIAIVDANGHIQFENDFSASSIDINLNPIID